MTNMRGPKRPLDSQWKQVIDGSARNRDDGGKGCTRWSPKLGNLHGPLRFERINGIEYAICDSCGMQKEA